MKQGEKLTPDEAQGVARSFLLSRYPKAKVTFNRVNLSAKESAPLYHLEGEIRMPSQNPLRVLFTPPEQYIFKIEVGAFKGEVLSWELE